MTLKLKYFIHLFIFDISTIIITAIVMTIEQTGIISIIGFIVLMISVNAIYYLGIKGVIKDLQK